MLTLDEAILHCQERAKADCSECAKEHQQLAEWLEELKILRKKQIPMEVSERTLLRDMYGRPYTIRGNCPVCGSSGLLASYTDYCNACGQKLKWDLVEVDHEKRF